MDATRFLKRQHGEVKRLFKQVGRTGGAKQRRELLAEIEEKLKLHTRIEEEVFYPAVKSLDSTKAVDMVNEALEGHPVVDLVLVELPKVDPRDERFEAKMTALEELVQHHVDEEEKEMFKVAARLGGGELKELGARLEEAANGGS